MKVLDIATARRKSKKSSSPRSKFMRSMMKAIANADPNQLSDDFVKGRVGKVESALNEIVDKVLRDCANIKK